MTSSLITSMYSPRLLNAGLPPIAQRNNDNQITNISCENSFSPSLTGIFFINANIAFPLSDPILSDVVITFDYDAYFKDGADEIQALMDVKHNIFRSVLEMTPLLSEDGTNVVDIPCDTLIENTIGTMLYSQGIIGRLSDATGNIWDHYLGLKNQPDDILSSQRTECSSSNTEIDGVSCKPITSFLTTQVPVDRDIDSTTIQTQILQRIKSQFENNMYLTDDIISMSFVGTGDDLEQQQTDVIENNGKFEEIKEEIKKILLSPFGISFTVLLVAAALGCVVLLMKGKLKIKRSFGSDSNEDDIESATEDPPEAVTPRAVYTHASPDAVEIVDVGFGCGDIEIIQSGFGGKTLGAWMDSLKDDTDSCCGFSSKRDDNDDDLLWSNVRNSS